MIKVLVPDMPTAEELLPYLRQIDESRVYVNRGRSVVALEQRLEKITGVPCITVSNGTLALELALTAAWEQQSILEREVLIPTVTFSATGLAALNGNFYAWRGSYRHKIDVRLCDVDEKTWQAQRPYDTECYAAVMPVAAFGVPVDIELWKDCACPVIIDAAGAFPAQKVSKDKNITTCFSLHATKFIGAGEGGFVTSANPDVIDRILDLTTFGQYGTNGKLSEYSAAVALASLDRMERKAERTTKVLNWYAERLASGAGLAAPPKVMKCTDTLLTLTLAKPYSEVKPFFDRADIEVKQWYRPFLHLREEFADGGEYPVADHLAKHLIGLPFHNFLTEPDIDVICSVLEKALA